MDADIKPMIPRWEAYANLFKEVMDRRRWSRNQLIDELKKDAKERRLTRCTYSVRGFEAYQADPTRVKNARTPEDYRIRHIHQFLTRQLRDLGEAERFAAELASIALAEGTVPPRKRNSKSRAGSSDLLKNAGGTRASATEEIGASSSTPGNLDPAAYIQDLIAEKTHDFVGREYVFDAVQAFVSTARNGYFHIVGDPGQGKTAILAELARKKSCVAIFNSQAEGRNGVNDFIKALRAQLPRPDSLPDTVLDASGTHSAEDVKLLLRQALAEKPSIGPLVIAVDALDEVNAAVRNYGENILCLPSNLPVGVFFIISSRRGVRVPLHSSTIRFLDLADYAAESLKDIRTYIERATKRDRIKGWLRSRQIRSESLVEELAKRSESNFMYVYYVLSDIERGNRSDMSLESLPIGLVHYYEMHWEKMGMTRAGVDKDKLRLLYRLVRARRPISPQLLGELSGVDPLEAQNILDHWAQFLHRTEIRGEPHFSVYHKSFSDFLERTDIVRAAGISLEEIDESLADRLLKDFHGEGNF
jgi:hypothetical protein